MRSMQNASPMMSAMATNDMNEASPSMNFVFNVLWKPGASVAAMSSAADAMALSSRADAVVSAAVSATESAVVAGALLAVCVATGVDGSVVEASWDFVTDALVCATDADGLALPAF